VNLSTIFTLIPGVHQNSLSYSLGSTSFTGKLVKKSEILHYSQAMKTVKLHATRRHTVCTMKDIIAGLTKDSLKRAKNNQTDRSKQPQETTQ